MFPTPPSWLKPRASGLKALAKNTQKTLSRLEYRANE
jgi:hypothetical protein